VRGALVLLTAVAAVVLAGCGETVDTAKQTFSRKTVPAGQDATGTGGGTTTGTPKTNDPAFSNEKLRALDPCALLSEDILAALGTPADNSADGFGNCSNYMEDKEGRDLSITLYVGETINNASEADENIGGLPAMWNELDDNSACFVSVITSTNPNVGIRTQVGGDAKDMCKIGQTVLSGVVDLIREDPPQREERAGSIAGVDPCALVDPAALKPVVGGADTEVSLYTLHWCNWVGESVTAGLWFRTGYDPKDSTTDPGQPVDLGNGLTGYAQSDGGGQCRIEWRHRSTGQDGDDEIIEVSFDNSAAAAGDNGCGTTAEIAKLIVPKLPKP
jgi:hypothetical protein